MVERTLGWTQGMQLGSSPRALWSVILVTVIETIYMKCPRNLRKRAYDIEIHDFVATLNGVRFSLDTSASPSAMFTSALLTLPS